MLSSSRWLLLALALGCSKAPSPGSQPAPNQPPQRSAHGALPAQGQVPVLESVPEHNDSPRHVPIGINDALPATAARTPELLRDLHAGFVSDHLPRRAIESGRNGERLDFSAVDAKLATYAAAPAGAWFVINVESRHRFGDGREVGRARKSEGKYLPDGPESYAAYEAFLRALVSHVQTAAPGLRVEYWSVDNEQFALFVPAYCGAADALEPRCGAEAAAAYAALLERSARIIRELDPQAKVVFGGPASSALDAEFELFYAPALRAVAQRGAGVFDCFDFHDFARADGWRGNARGKGIEFFRGLIAEAGLPTKCILVKAGATHTGRDDAWKPPRLQAPQTETEQASYLVKRFAHHLGSGLTLVLWGTVREDGEAHGIFSHNGLMYDGVPGSADCDAKREQPCPDPGDGIQKLSYYSFKLLAQSLEGVARDGASSVDLGADGVYAYRFARPAGALWIAWSEDGPRRVSLGLAGRGPGALRITDAVPTFDGEQQTGTHRLRPDDYPTFFRTRSAEPRDGAVQLELGPIPVLIE
jgi:hypothetical protein